MNAIIYLNYKDRNIDTLFENIKNAGSKYKIKPVQAAKQLVQLKGLKSKYHFLWNWCISTKNIAKHIAAIIIIIKIIYFV